MTLLGHLDSDSLADLYANADVFVHPNPREPFGIAPLEAMASGIPTLAPDSGGILSYATPGNSWLRKPDAQQFAGAVREIVANPELKTGRVARALETARANTRERSTDFLIDTYDRICEEFNERRELFVNGEKSRHFDFARALTPAGGRA